MPKMFQGLPRTSSNARLLIATGQSTCMVSHLPRSTITPDPWAGFRAPHIPSKCPVGRLYTALACSWFHRLPLWTKFGPQSTCGHPLAPLLPHSSLPFAHLGRNSFSPSWSFKGCKLSIMHYNTTSNSPRATAYKGRQLSRD